MTQIISLFSNQTEADQAVTALNTAGLENDTIHTMVATPGTDVVSALELRGDTARIIQNKTENGGILVIVEPPENNLTTIQIKHLLKEEGALLARVN